MLSLCGSVLLSYPWSYPWSFPWKSAAQASWVGRGLAPRCVPSRCKGVAGSTSNSNHSSPVEPNITLLLVFFIYFGIFEIFVPISISFFLSTPLTPLLSFPSPGLNLDQAPSNHFNSDL